MVIAVMGVVMLRCDELYGIFYLGSLPELDRDKQMNGVPAVGLKKSTFEGNYDAVLFKCSLLGLICNIDMQPIISFSVVGYTYRDPDNAFTMPSS